jgi:hypothetical protein
MKLIYFEAAWAAHQRILATRAWDTALIETSAIAVITAAIRLCKPLS